MNQLNSVSNLPVKYNGPSTQLTSPFFKLPRSCKLESMRYLPKLGDALCMVRDLETGAIKQVLASRLYVYEFGDKGAFMVMNEVNWEVK